MSALKSIAWVVIAIYGVVVLLLYSLQTRLIFYPRKLDHDFRFSLGERGEEISLETSDGERINALFFRGSKPDVVLYFHGNAGDLSGWQFVSEDFTKLDFNFLIIDYRGYGKSSGSISERGLYRDADAAYQYLSDREFAGENILVYGRSIGSGVAVDLASRKKIKGLILEAPYTSLGALANEKLPLLSPSLYLRFRFDNLAKINRVSCPVAFLHGADDELIPVSHTHRLFEKFSGPKTKIIVDRGSHNDLHSFRQYSDFLETGMGTFFGRE